MAGPIEQSLVGVTDRKEIARLRAQGILAAFQALPAGQRASFTFDGLRVTLTSAPTLIRDRQDHVIGFQLTARATQGGAPLPFLDAVHRVINPPTKVPDGTTRAATQEDGSVVQMPNYVEDPVQAMKLWLVDSIRTEARAAGWGG